MKWAHAEKREERRGNFKKEKRIASKVSDRKINVRGRKMILLIGDSILIFPKNEEETGIVKT